MSESALTVAKAESFQVPAIVAEVGPEATKKFFEFFTVPIRNKNTRIAYYHAIGRFLDWCDQAGFQSLEDIEPITVAAYFEQHPGSPPTVKQHMAAIRMLFSWLTEKGILAMNPAREVKTRKFSRTEGKTPAPPHQEVQRLLDSIDVTHLVGLRDRALLAVMAYTFARIGARFPNSAGLLASGQALTHPVPGKRRQGKRNSGPSQTGGIPRRLSRSRRALGTACKPPFPIYSGQVARARDRWTLT